MFRNQQPPNYQQSPQQVQYQQPIYQQSPQQVQYQQPIYSQTRQQQVQYQQPRQQPPQQQVQYQQRYKKVPLTERILMRLSSKRARPQSVRCNNVEFDSALCSGCYANVITGERVRMKEGD